MYLKAIEIKGFKSFMDKTYISFPKGMISIVGPNGSGKSNILDAVRWVLGEQSIKSLRGDKLEDVIFSGTQNRSPMGYCEVTLILDNTDKTAEIEYSELSIKRKAYKSGESQFFLNGKRCRLKDIKELLLDTGIGKEGYSIISQGKIDEIISSNSAQKRALLEEASGITKFRYKKVESEKNLQQSNENLDRIKDIFSEIENQIKPLQMQKEKAEKYIDLSTKLKIQEINKNLRTKEKLDKEIKETEKKAEDFKSAEEEKKNEIEKNRNFLKSSNQDLETVSLNRQELYSEKSNLQKILSSNIKNQELKDKEIQNLISTNSLLQDQFNDSNRQIDDTKTNLEKLKSDFEKKTKQRESLEKETTEIKRKNELGQENIKKISISLNEKTQKMRTLENEMAKLEARIDFQNQNIKSFKDQFLQYQKTQDDLEFKIKSITEKAVEKEEKSKREKDVLEDIKSSSEKNSSDIQECGKKLFEINDKISKNNLNLKDICAKTQVLENFENEMQGFSKGTRSILKDKSLSGIENVVANVIKVKKGYEKAVEQLLGSRLENIIIKEAKDAKEAIKKLKKDHLGRATFLPMDTIKPSYLNYSDRGVKAIDVVEFEEKYFDIVSNLLGKMVIVDDMDMGLEISKKYKNSFKIATKTGEIFNAGGSITGGSSAYSKEIFTRRSVIEENKKNIQKIQKDTQILESDREKINLEIKKLNEDKIRLENELRIQSEKIENTNRQYFELMSKKENIEENLKRLFEEKSQVSEINEKAEQSLKKDISSIELMKKNLTQINMEIENISFELDNQKQESSKYLTLLNEKITSLSVLKQEIKNIEENIKNINEIINSNSKKSQIAMQKIGQNTEKISKNKKEIEDLKIQYIEHEEKMKSMEEKFCLINKKEEEINREIKQTTSQIEKLTDQQNAAIKEKIRLESIVENLRYRINLLQENMIQTYGIDFNSCNDLRDESIKVSDESIKNLKSEIEKLGNVNLDAIEEFRKVNQRYLFYKEQKEDLEESILKIGSIIKRLEKTMVENFKQSFKLINSNFNDIFRILFGGGDAKLVLLDENNVLESEIEINVHPPGKKLRNIAMLSGGEKALCAIALLFAIIAKKPVPFCILDEIDAPLDDANIYRYVGYLSTLSDTTQFITITHRRGTMEESDYIYGVTMQEKGVSNIVSLKLEDAKDFVED